MTDRLARTTVAGTFTSARIEQEIEESRTAGFVATIWAALFAAAVAIKLAYSAPAWVLVGGLTWFALMLVVMLMQTRHAGRSYLRGTLRKRSFTQVYYAPARKVCDFFWKRLCHPVADKASPLEVLRATSTPLLFDRALLLAVAYPILSLVLVWLLGWDARLGPEAVAFPTAGFLPDRAIVLGQLVIITLGVVGRRLASTELRKQWIGAGAMGVAFAVACISTGNPFTPGADTVFGGAGAILLAVPLVYLCITMFKFRGSCAIALIFVFACSIIIVVSGEGDITIEGFVLVGVTIALPIVVIPTLILAGLARTAVLLPALTLPFGWVATMLIVPMPALDEVPRALFLFLGVFPLVNGVFDALSYAITLALMRLGLRARLPFALWLADLGLALALFLVLGAAMVAVVATINAVAGGSLIDLGALFAGLREAPGDYWWLYLMLFSTILPTALHGLIALLGVQGLTPYSLRLRVADWISGAQHDYAMAVGTMLAVATIWWLPLTIIAAALWSAWQHGERLVTSAALFYLDTLERLAVWVGAL